VIVRGGLKEEMMTETAGSGVPEADDRPTRRSEIAAFLVLAVLIWPIIAVGIVGGYGFLVWMSQVVLGPPGPPH
jgi:nitrate reductase NapE